MTMPRRSGETVRIKKASVRPPPQSSSPPSISPLVLPEEKEIDQFAKVLQGLAVISGDKINIPFLAGKERFFQVEATSPSGGVIINQKTKFLLKKPDFSLEAAFPCLLRRYRRTWKRAETRPGDGRASPALRRSL